MVHTALPLAQWHKSGVRIPGVRGAMSMMMRAAVSHCFNFYVSHAFICCARRCVCCVALQVSLRHAICNLFPGGLLRTSLLPIFLKP